MRQGNNSRRSRGRGNGKRHPRGSNQIDSHGPEVRVRGTAQQVFDKYLALGRDATSIGDRIAAENLFQHAEHYSRVLALAQENAENRNDTREEGKNRREDGLNTDNTPEQKEFRFVSVNLNNSRLVLLQALSIVIRNAMTILGVSTPKIM